MPIKPKSGESKDEYIGRCIGIEINNGYPKDQAAAMCIYKAEEHFSTATQSAILDLPPANIDFESYSDYPESVKNNAKSVLDWVETNGWGSCGTPVGKVRANQLANGEAISVDTIQRMYSYLSRHEVDLQSSKSYSDGCGKLMYDSWGGLSAKSWSHNKLKELGLIELASEKISFDYDGTISTSKGQEMAKRLIDEGNTVYIISARSSKEGMLRIADRLGIPHSRVYATGSNKAKAEKVKELGITKHMDDNSLLKDLLPGIAEKFGKVKRIIFNEDFDLETLLEYKKLGFSIHIKSKRKYQRSDHKTYNKLRSVGLSTDNLVFGEMRDLNDKYGYDLMMTGTDPILEGLKVRGKDISKLKVIKSIDISSLGLAEQSIEEAKNVDMKFATIKVYFTYEKKDEVSGAELLPTSRQFCKDMMFANKAYTLDEIKSLPTEHLTKMGLPADVFAYRGGFYTVKGGVRGPDTTPSCRHTFKAKIVVE